MHTNSAYSIQEFHHLRMMTRDEIIDFVSRGDCGNTFVTQFPLATGQRFSSKSYAHTLVAIFADPWKKWNICLMVRRSGILCKMQLLAREYFDIILRCVDTNFDEGFRVVPSHKRLKSRCRSSAEQGQWSSSTRHLCQETMSQPTFTSGSWRPLAVQQTQVTS